MSNPRFKTRLLQKEAISENWLAGALARVSLEGLAAS